ncbi:MAG TPA: PTS beta-glucoside transporter subunit IIABC, partial [Lactococcus sp.]|nr:PTS beta-glucoside transporter subunit IIABC [Lactococcus sp.]
MADYKKLAADIIEAVGGEENITKAIHCITRLRFYLVDKDKADSEKIEAMDGVAGVVYNANLGQYQVVIGQAVADVYDEIVAQLGSRVVEGADDNIVTEENKVSKNPVARAFQVVVGTITGSMMPIIGLLAAGGMINGILNMFVKGNHIFELISPTDPTYIIISTLAMAPFYFLPVLVGYAAAKQLGSDPYVVAAVGGFMIHPALQGLVAAPNIIQNGEIVAGKAPVVMEFFGVTFNTSYFNI